MRRLTGQQKQRYSSGLIAIEVQESFDSKVHMSATHVKVGRASNVENLASCPLAAWMTCVGGELPPCSGR